MFINNRCHIFINAKKHRFRGESTTKSTTPDLSILSYELVPTRDLQPDPRNPKQHGPEQIEKLKATILTTGWGRPLLANKRTGLIIAGEGAWIAAQALGMARVPVVWTDIDPGEALILMLADNRLAELGEVDPAKLGKVFDEIKFSYPALDIETTGYTLNEITQFLPDGGQATEDFFDTEAALEQIEEPETRPGDLWILGSHRLLCADSTNPEALKILMNGKQARLVVTDPPYNVSYDQAKNANPPRIHRPGDLINNDSMNPGEFKLFLIRMMRSIFSVCPGPYYIFMSCKEWPRIMQVFEDCGGHWSSTIIWNKSNHVISRKDYHPKFEPILYGWKEPEPALIPDYQPILYGWTEGAQVRHLEARNKSDVWDIAKPSANVQHPTMKPVELMAEPIKNSTDLGDIIVDLFLGSGSCLIAAEQLGRVCYGIETVPKYVEICVQRWEALTGKKAVRIPGDY